MKENRISWLCPNCNTKFSTDHIDIITCPNCRFDAPIQYWEKLKRLYCSEYCELRPELHTPEITSDPKREHDGEELHRTDKLKHQKNNSWNIGDMFLMMGLGAKFFEHDKMTLEEALNLVDPSVISPPSIDKNLDMFKDIKSRALVVKFAREALENQKKADSAEKEVNHD